jgi:transmembrane sensor
MSQKPDLSDMAEKDRSTAKQGLPEISEEEIEQALGNVHKRLGFPGQDSDSTAWYANKWTLAAILIVTAIGAGLMLFSVTVTAPYGDRLAYTLPDGTDIELNSGSRITYNRPFGLINRNLTIDGEAYFIVRSGTHPFMIRAGQSVIEITGTELNVRYWSDDPSGETSVTVVNGQLDFYPRHTPALRQSLRRGETSRWSPDLAEPTTPDTASATQALAWRDNHLSFVEQPVGQILKELERRFDVEIELEDEHVKRETLTSFYRDPQSVESILNDISTVKGLSYSRTAKGFRLSRTSNESTNP